MSGGKDDLENIWLCIDGTVLYEQPNEYARAEKYTRSPPVPDDVAAAITLASNTQSFVRGLYDGRQSAYDAIYVLIRAASTPSPEAQAVSEVTVEEFTQELQHYRQFIHGAYISPAEYMLKKYPHGIKIKAGGK